jgi:hypothetical protein
MRDLEGNNGLRWGGSSRSETVYWYRGHGRGESPCLDLSIVFIPGHGVKWLTSAGIPGYACR